MKNERTNHAELLNWVKAMAELCTPDRIVWCDGSESEKKRLEQEAVGTGELVELNQEKMPGCFYHRTAVNDVARTEHLTYICTAKQEDAGPTNNWMAPEEAYEKARQLFKGAMKGRTMYVIPFSMGPIGSVFSKIGVELTDSIYVVLNMRIMTRMGTAVLEALGSKGEFTKCLHSKADLDIYRRLILHFPEDNTIWSVGSGYGGNVLLGKKCLALRIASYLGMKEGWMAEHMLILGIEKPNGEIQYVAGAFPSACGKTNLAMLVPPEGLKHKGYRIWTVGDDIAWMRIGKDGRLWAINPENGFFGVLPGTGPATNPLAMETIKENTIFTNVALCPDGTVWWEGKDDNPPAEAIDWKGDKWQPGMKDKDGKPVLAAHPNSRFTAPISQCPSFNPKIHESTEGVPISAIIFGGRRAGLVPLVYESFNWRHGVFVGSQIASERTAAQFGKQGEVRPGFGDNLRVLEWILDRSNGKVDAVETPIGYIPKPNSLDLTGLNLNPETLKELFDIDPGEWMPTFLAEEEFLAQFGSKLPQELREDLEDREKRFQAVLKNKH